MNILNLQTQKEGLMIDRQSKKNYKKIQFNK